MKVEVFDITDTGWMSNLQDLSYDVYHLPQYIAAEDQFRGSTTKLYVVRENSHSLVVPLELTAIPGNDEYSDAASPYGYATPIASDKVTPQWANSALLELIRFLQQQRVVTLFLRSHPLLGFGSIVFEGVGTVVHHGETVSIPLGRSFDDIRMDMRKSHRYEIRKALRSGQEVVLDSDWQHLDDFFEIYSATMDRLDASDGYYFNREYFEALRDSLSDHVFLWTTRIDGAVAAASIMTECNGIVQYHLSGTHPDYIKSYPTKVLLDEVANWANERGNVSFHLGGGLGGSEDSLFGFKAGFGKGRHPFYTVRSVVNQAEYDRLVAEWEARTDASAVDLSGFFPVYRKP